MEEDKKVEELLNSAEVILHQFLICNKFPAIYTDKDTFRIQVNYTHGYSDYAEFKQLMQALPPTIKTSITHLVVFGKLEEFYKAHETKTLWKLLPSLQYLQDNNTEETNHLP